MWTSETYFFITASFLLAGGIKGLIGLGFPTIILAMLAIRIGVPDAMAIMILPCFLTNVWQALSGGNFRSILLRIWPLLLTASITAWITTSYIGDLDGKLLSGLLGLIVCTYSIIGLTTPKVVSPGKHERWMTPAIGLVNGVVTGLTGTFVVPGVLYLQSLRMKRDLLIQAMGILFLVSTSALGTGLFSHDLMNGRLVLLSAAALIPSFLGMAVGQRIRRTIPEKGFRKLFYGSLLLLGLYIILRCI